MLQALLDSPQDALLDIRLRTAQGVVYKISVVADHPVSFVTEPVAATSLPAWCLLPEEFEHIGYVDASRITIKTIERALDELSSAAALIVDLRRYPTLPVESLQRFRRYRVPLQLTLQPVMADPEGAVSGWRENRFYARDVFLPMDTPDERPLAALIGGGQVSMGEDWVYQLRVGCGAMLIGGVTAGGVGSNALVHLPGAGRASLSGSRVTKGALPQIVEGNGIAPDITVKLIPNDNRDSAVVVAANTLLQRLAGR